MQSVSEPDDLFSDEGLEKQSSDTSLPAPGTIHYPRSSQLRDKGVYLVVSDSSSYEYTCPTHSAAELRAISQRLTRMEGMSTRSMKFNVSDALKRIEEHVDLHREHVRYLISKL